jgi:hypothetical protein
MQELPVESMIWIAIFGLGGCTLAIEILMEKSFPEDTPRWSPTGTHMLLTSIWLVAVLFYHATIKILDILSL